MRRFADVLAVEHVIRRAAAAVVITDMLPDYGDVWRRPDEALMCAELCIARFAWLDIGHGAGTEAASSGVRG